MEKPFFSWLFFRAGQDIKCANKIFLCAFGWVLLQKQWKSKVFQEVLTITAVTELLGQPNIISHAISKKFIYNKTLLAKIIVSMLQNAMHRRNKINFLATEIPTVYSETNLTSMITTNALLSLNL